MIPDTINLDAILGKCALMNLSEAFTNYELDAVKSCMTEAIRQALEIAAEEARITSGYVMEEINGVAQRVYFHDIRYSVAGKNTIMGVDKQSILNVINRIK